MDNLGWVKDHRKSKYHPLYKKPLIWHLFKHLVREANFETKVIPWNGAPFEVERGSLICGRKNLAYDTGLSEKNVRTALSHLKNFQMIEISASKSASKFSYITILNYEKYQVRENTTGQQTGHEGASSGPAKGQQRATNKNDKNEKKVKKEKNKDIYGQFRNVLLTIEEKAKVTEEEIENLSEGIASKGYKYDSHYATILSWRRKNGGKPKTEKKQSLFEKNLEAGKRWLERSENEPSTKA